MLNKNIKIFLITFVFILINNFNIINAFAAPFYLSIKDNEGINEITRDNLMDKKNKIVFLTFDDGPSRHNTEKILDILTKNNVKASFFIIGGNAERNKSLLKKLDENGMAIYPHCYNHNYKELYKSKESYMEDLKRCMDIINESGISNNEKYVRMPGGSNNSNVDKKVIKDIKNEILNSGYNYIDWNVDSMDAYTKKISVDTIKRNVIKESQNTRIAVVLFHDSEIKINTVEALQYIIDFYKTHGYEFKTLNQVTLQEKKRMTDSLIINR